VWRITQDQLGKNVGYILIYMVETKRKLTYYMMNKIEEAVTAAEEKINDKNINWEGYEKELERNNNLQTYQNRLKKASLYFFRRDNPRSKLSDKEYKEMFVEWLDDKIVKNVKRDRLRNLPWWRVNKYLKSVYWG